MDALDGLALDVRRSGRARHEDEWSPFCRGALEAAQQLGNRLDDLVLTHDANVEVGKQRQRTPPLSRTAVEGDRAGDGASPQRRS